MTGSEPSPGDVERFRSALGERLGLWLDDAKLTELSGLLARRAAAHALAPAAYFALLEEATRGKLEQRVLAQELTVTETFFFRQGDHLNALIDQLGRRGGPAAILSAGCASGEEPYSIAITLRERLPHLSEVVTIRAVDINPAMLERARTGVYSAWALRETPEPIAQRWLKHSVGGFVLDRAIRDSVSFEERNLAERNADLLAPASYDAVFFRNVLMYFTPRAQAEIIARLAQALRPGGLLFLGYAETLRGLSTAFHLRHSRDTFYYQKREDASPNEAPEPRHEPSAALGVPLEAAPGVHWFDAIGQASARVRQLTEARADAEHNGRPTDARADAFDLDPAIELLRKERYGEALDTMSALPHGATHDLDALLLRSALLVHSGQLAAARATCTELLARDELNAGAHYLIALICEGERDPAGAAEHHLIAAYLDQTFAMPRLHLGLLARRRGDVLAARRELRQAHALLGREETARLVLFAGGFERSALLALCRAELTACGGAP